MENIFRVTGPLCGHFTGPRQCNEKEVATDISPTYEWMYEGNAQALYDSIQWFPDQKSMVSFWYGFLITLGFIEYNVCLDKCTSLTTS